MTRSQRNDAISSILRRTTVIVYDPLGGYGRRGGHLFITLLLRGCYQDTRLFGAPSSGRLSINVSTFSWKIEHVCFFAVICPITIYSDEFERVQVVLDSRVRFFDFRLGQLLISYDTEWFTRGWKMVKQIRNRQLLYWHYWQHPIPGRGALLRSGLSPCQFKRREACAIQDSSKRNGSGHKHTRAAY
jgi:hypothetical protein